MLISNAYAQAANGAGTADTLMQMLPLVLMFVVLYFLMIRPQMKKAKEHKAMVDALQKGDEVITQGGVVGRITKIGEAYLHVEVAANTEIVVQKQAVGALLPKGTLKSI